MSAPQEGAPQGSAPRQGVPQESVPLYEERFARAAWSALAEPGDEVAGTLVQVLGAVRAWQWVRRACATPQDVPWQLLEEHVGPCPPSLRARLGRAVGRWAVRMGSVQAARDLDGLVRLGGELLVPGDARWPTAIDALGPAAPFCLWVRGETDLAGAWRRSAALVGARAATTYGERVAYDVADGLAGSGMTVVSGGAYGIDAAAHRGALARGGATSVVLAGGIDRAYPAGNARLFEAVVGTGGSLVTELGPGHLPTRSRFLQRNRLIAGATLATVVVEAAWRSGAMSTAHHAARLLRPVGAVPGPVTSAASAGCHRLLRDGVAVCVTDAAEVVELAGTLGADLAQQRTEQTRPGDGLDPVARRVLDALPCRAAQPAERVAGGAGVMLDEALAALGLLEIAGLAVRASAGWRRTSQT